MHVMAQFAGEDGDLCTAEAIGPHTILTATHCMLTNPDSVKIDGAPVQITQRINDGNDHTILTFTNVYFNSFVKPVFAQPVAGEFAWFWGNPGDLRDMYREGYCAGFAKMARGPYAAFVILAIPGDSGSAVFNERGEIIGVVSMTNGDHTIMASFPLAFTPEQLAKVI